MLTRSFMILLVIVLSLSMVLFVAAASVFIITTLITSEARRRLNAARTKRLELVVLYTDTYFAPLTRAAGKLNTALRHYTGEQSQDSAFRAFFCYCCFLYQAERLESSGVPLPFSGKQQVKYSESYLSFLRTSGMTDSEKEQSRRIATPQRGEVPESQSIYNEIFERERGSAAYQRFSRFLAEADAQTVKNLLVSLTRMEALLLNETARLFAESRAVLGWEILAEMLRELVSELRQGRSLDVPLSDSTDPAIKVATTAGIETMRVGTVVGVLSLGVIYLAGFGALAWRQAAASGRDPIDVLLLVRLPASVEQQFAMHVFPRLAMPESAGVVYAIGASVGAILIGGAVAGAANTVRVGVGAQGLLNGIGLTSAIGYVVGSLPFDTTTLRLWVFKVAYLLAAFAILSSLPDLFGKAGVRRGKYDRFFGAIYTATAAWVLTRGFGSGAILLNGVIFAPSWFVGTALAEAILARNPRFVGAEYFLPMTVREFLVKAWAERTRVMLVAGGVATLGVAFHALLVFGYQMFVAGKM